MANLFQKIPLLAALFLGALSTHAAPPPARLRTWETIGSAREAKAIEAAARKNAILVIDPHLTGFEPPEAARKANPDLAILARLNVLTRSPAGPWWKSVRNNEHWFYHDDEGERIEIADPDRPTGLERGFAMDPGQPPYRTWCLARAKRFRRSGFDGALLHGILPYSPFVGRHVSDVPTRRMQGRRVPFTEAEIVGDMHALLRTVTQGIGRDVPNDDTPNEKKPFPVLIHALRPTNMHASRRLAKEAGGAVMQPPIVEHGAFNALLFAPRIELSKELTDNEKTVLFDASCAGDATAAEVRNAARLALAGYLLSESPTTALRFTGNDPPDLRAARSLLGKATGEAAKTDDGLWTRPFARGRVLVYPTRGGTIEVSIKEGERLLLDDRTPRAGKLPLEGADGAIVVEAGG